MEKRRLRLKRCLDVRPLVFLFPDSEALLLFAAGCRRIQPDIPASLYRLPDGYRLIYRENKPLPPALLVLLSETAELRGGTACAAATAAAGIRLSEDAISRMCFTGNGSVQPMLPDPPP